MTADMQCPVCNGQKKNRKSVTCSRACANTFFRSGRNNGNHRKGEHNHRTICFMFHPKVCVVCGESNLVDVHHFDKNHHNNDPTNLVPICPTHHQYLHSSHRHLVEDKVNAYHERFFETLPLLEGLADDDDMGDLLSPDSGVWASDQEV